MMSNANIRELCDIKNDVKIILSNKLSISQSKLLFMGITYEIILRKDLFPKNSNLKLFINNVYFKQFKNKETFRDYLFASRTILGARLLRKIKNELDYDNIIIIVKSLLQLLPEDSLDKNYGGRFKKNEINEWMKFIGERND